MKDKIIEEMAKDVCENIMTKQCADGTCPKTWDCPYNETMAKILIEKGYRKIPEGAVVLTREEYEQLKSQIDDLTLYNKNYKYRIKELQKDNEGLAKQCEKMELELNDCIGIKANTRKETAEKFAEILKGRLKVYLNEDLDFLMKWCECRTCIDEIVKELVDE